MFITTSRFTEGARTESERDGVPPITLVEGEELADMLKEKGLGFKDDGTIDPDWFKNL